jgi:hypothetical protein
MALKSDGTVEAWGYNFYGQCNVPAGLSGVTAIACGGYFSLALKNDGTVAAWGDNFYGQTNVPADLTNVVAIAAGGLHGLALKADGTVEGWGALGAYDFGQATPPTNLVNVTGITAGFYHSLALSADGTITQWGDTAEGQSTPPTNLTSVLALSAGYAHSYALKNDSVVLLVQPTNITTLTNRTVSFVVKASGATPMRATWWRTGSPTNISFGSVVFTNNTTSTSFSGGTVQASPATNLSAAQFTLTLNANSSFLTNPGTYSIYAVLTNSLGTVTSSVVTLTVMLPPKITSQPTSVATNAGGTVVLTAGVSGTPPFTYQWLLNGQPLSNLVNPTNVLELDNVSTNDAGSYQLVVSNAVGSATSSNAVLTVDGSPAITVQPTNTSVVLGNDATFTSVVNGADPLVYQWYYYQSASNNTVVPLPSGTNASYTVSAAQTNDAGNYFFIVTNGLGAATSSVVTLTVQTPPIIVTQPTNITTLTNRAVSFVVRASGVTPMRGTWWRTGSSTNTIFSSVLFTNTTTTSNFSGGSVQGSAGTNLAGAQFTLTLNATSSFLTNVGTYSIYAVLTNSLGTVTSSVVTLTVMQPPKITNQPTSVATTDGATVVFSAGVSGTPPFTYQWLLNGQPLTNLFNPTNVLELDNVSTNDAGSYQLVVSNAVGSAISSNAVLTVDGSPAITVQPTNTSVVLGNDATFISVINGADPLVYQWYYFQSASNSTVVPLPAGTNALYTVSAAQTNDAGNYFFVVTNGLGAATSSVVTLTVQTPPIIVTQPTNITTVTNRSVSFVVRASGVTPMRGTWWRTGSPTNASFASIVFTNNTTSTGFTGGTVQASPVTNFTGAQFTLTLAATGSYLTNPGTYSIYAILTNSLGTVTSDVVTLTVMLPPKITSQPAGVATNVGATVFLSTTVTGSQPLYYEWLFNGQPLANLLNPTNVLELDNVSPSNAGTYQLVVSNAVGSATSSGAYVYLLTNGSATPPQLYLLSHDQVNGDGIMIALEAGRNYRVQTSTDLSTWTDLTNFLSQSSLVTFTNSEFTNLPSLYYRVVTP